MSRSCTLCSLLITRQMTLKFCLTIENTPLKHCNHSNRKSNVLPKSSPCPLNKIIDSGLVPTQWLVVTLYLCIKTKGTVQNPKSIKHLHFLVVQEILNNCVPCYTMTNYLALIKYCMLEILTRVCLLFFIIPYVCQSTLIYDFLNSFVPLVIILLNTLESLADNSIMKAVKNVHNIGKINGYFSKPSDFCFLSSIIILKKFNLRTLKAGIAGF